MPISLFSSNRVWVLCWDNGHEKKRSASSCTWPTISLQLLTGATEKTVSPSVTVLPLFVLLSIKTLRCQGVLTDAAFDLMALV